MLLILYVARPLFIATSDFHNSEQLRISNRSDCYKRVGYKLSVRHPFLLTPCPPYLQELMLPSHHQSQTLSPAHSLTKVDRLVTQFRVLHWGTLLVESIRTEVTATRIRKPIARLPRKEWKRDMSMSHSRSGWHASRRRQRPPPRHHPLASIHWKKATFRDWRRPRIPKSFVNFGSIFILSMKIHLPFYR